MICPKSWFKALFFDLKKLSYFHSLNQVRSAAFAKREQKMLLKHCEKKNLNQDFNLVNDRKIFLSKLILRHKNSLIWDLSVCITQFLKLSKFYLYNSFSAGIERENRKWDALDHFALYDDAGWFSLWNLPNRTSPIEIRLSVQYIY